MCDVANIPAVRVWFGEIQGRDHVVAAQHGENGTQFEAAASGQGVDQVSFEAADGGLGAEDLDDGLSFGGVSVLGAGGVTGSA